MNGDYLKSFIQKLNKIQNLNPYFTVNVFQIVLKKCKVFKFELKKSLLGRFERHYMY